MKKFLLILIAVLLLVPINVSADKLYTKISGNEEILPGANIVYTVILDTPLTEYEAVIEYDRDILNLVSVDEVKIDTAERTFEVVKDTPATVKINSDEQTTIIYKITFMAKNNISVSNTNIGINTSKAVLGKDSLIFDEVDYKISFIEEDPLFIDEDEINNEDNYLDKAVNSVGKLLQQYGNPITYVSLGLNVMLLILLINSGRRKRVDYDF